MIPGVHTVNTSAASDQTDGKIWRQIRTGDKSDYGSIRRDRRGFPLFVKGSSSTREDADRRVVLANYAPSSDINTTTSELQEESVKDVDDQAIALRSTDADRGSSIATFYSRLPRVKSEVVASCNQPVTTDSLPATTHRAAETRSHSNIGADWFIKKATAKIDKSKHEPSRVSLKSSAIDSQCTVCALKIPIVNSAEAWEAHQSSIAHQLAANGPIRPQDVYNVSSRIAAKKSTRDAESNCASQIALKPTNIGYTALERMGWKKGLGLGRAESEYAKKEDERKRLASKKEMTVLTDSENDRGEAEKAVGDEGLTTARVELLDQCKGRRNDSIEIDFGKISPSIEHKREEVRVRPLLEPLIVRPRPDRRGIGKVFHISPKTGRMDKKLSILKADHKSQERLTKRQRLEREQREKEEWKQLRNSLN